jgi:hypothetical protein
LRWAIYLSSSYFHEFVNLHRFQPNQQLGKQLIGALQQQQMLASRQLKAQSISQDIASQFQIEQNISSRVLQKRQELEREEENTAQKRPREDDSGQASSADFESSSFVGRSMLANLGWKEGSALGKRGGAAQGLISVSKKTSKSGLGRPVGESDTKYCGSSSSSCSSSSSSGDVWEKAQSRYNKIVKESKER